MSEAETPAAAPGPPARLPRGTRAGSCLMVGSALLLFATAELAARESPDDPAEDRTETSGAPPAEPAAADSDTVEVAGDTLIPFPFYFYSPETKSGGGLALTYLTRPEGSGLQAKPSAFGAVFLFTQRRQFVASLGADLYWDEESNELLAGLDFSRFPDTFYGIGNDTDADVSEDYTPQTIGLRLALRKEIRPELRVGPQVSFAHQEMKKVEDGKILDQGQVPGSRGGTVVGLGLTATWDGRDRIIYPRAGVYREVLINVSDEVLGSDFSYAEAHLEVRRYFALSGAQTLALRGMFTAMSGEPPFQMLAGLGGESILRGYYAGRFRDRNRYVAEGEYRLGFWKRLGLVVFGGVGDVSRDLGTFRLSELKWIGGYGLRFLLSRSEGVTLRADFGYGDDGSTGFYLGILEVY